MSVPTRGMGFALLLSIVGQMVLVASQTIPAPDHVLFTVPPVEDSQATIFYLSAEPFSGFQFNVVPEESSNAVVSIEDATLADPFKGDFTISTNGVTVLVFSLTGAIFESTYDPDVSMSAMLTMLAVLKLGPVPNGVQLCLSQMVVAGGPGGKQLDPPCLSAPILPYELPPPASPGNIVPIAPVQLPPPAEAESPPVSDCIALMDFTPEAQCASLFQTPQLCKASTPQITCPKTCCIITQGGMIPSEVSPPPLAQMPPSVDGPPMALEAFVKLFIGPVELDGTLHVLYQATVPFSGFQFNLASEDGEPIYPIDAVAAPNLTYLMVNLSDDLVFAFIINGQVIPAVGEESPAGELLVLEVDSQLADEAVTMTEVVVSSKTGMVLNSSFQVVAAPPTLPPPVDILLPPQPQLEVVIDVAVDTQDSTGLVVINVQSGDVETFSFTLVDEDSALPIEVTGEATGDNVEVTIDKESSTVLVSYVGPEPYEGFEFVLFVNTTSKNICIDDVELLSDEVVPVVQCAPQQDPEAEHPPPPPLDSPPPQDSNNDDGSTSWMLIIIVVLASSIAMILMLWCCCFFIGKNRDKEANKDRTFKMRDTDFEGEVPEWAHSRTSKYHNSMYA